MPYCVKLINDKECGKLCQYKEAHTNVNGKEGYLCRICRGAHLAYLRKYRQTERGREVLSKASRKHYLKKKHEKEQEKIEVYDCPCPTSEELEKFRLEYNYTCSDEMLLRRYKLMHSESYVPELDLSKLSIK